MNGRLYLVPSPLNDSNFDGCIPEEVKNVVGRLKYFIVEDVRTARRFLSGLKIQTPISELNFSIFNEHTPVEEVPALLSPVFQGNDVGLLSDAGMPCIADPGEELVRYAHSRDVCVVALSGSSSIFMALAASGLSGEKFSFEGYLPVKMPELIKTLKKLEQSSRTEQQSKIFIEAPYRNAKMLETAVNTCMPETFLCIACNLTSDGFVKTKKIREWKNNIPDLNKKPCIFILQSFA
ncbi:MAG: SAM-dependent methyltransferase [Prevotellaceae bacterium]|jgi:16S rRNA (cytidine1402-2'-O)-methyltransferase|nr:SAM-dependent methyltransferase [Prevotellaceae bacterium]